ncbi:hypothetical protein [Sulfuricurvum sp.]|uniref:hypothetical protein n=1 Tax=Sulfuricurvum sp. TaxID=2025608 RepID=UPI0026307ED4|nr:hypothetical protein [Sulfuricurvum sp.]MDD2267890.1 hypothetical protein [Sulfuricurvum sp.]
MKKITMLIMATIAAAAFDETPNGITKKDIMTLQNFAPTVYEKTKLKTKDAKIAAIAAFILEKMPYKIEYNRLKIEASAGVGRRTARNGDEGSTGAVFPSDFNYYTTGIVATYPLYDAKETRDIEKQKLNLKMSIIDDVKKFFDAEIAARAARDRLEIEELKQIRAKARAAEGVIALDDRISIMEKIADLREKVATNEAEQGAAKEKLLAYLNESDKREFEELIK